MRASEYYFPSLTGCQTAFTKKRKKGTTLKLYYQANISFMRIWYGKQSKTLQNRLIFI